jgi:hypothetical protein
MKTRNLIVFSLALAAAALAPACTVDDPGPKYAEGYQPQLYEGYVVYYDDGGRPFYYVNGVITSVPNGSPHYAELAAHWHSNGAAYRGWDARYGARYRSYRSTR